jgi:hypothetical protein
VSWPCNGGQAKDVLDKRRSQTGHAALSTDYGNVLAWKACYNGICFSNIGRHDTTDIVDQCDIREPSAEHVARVLSYIVKENSFEMLVKADLETAGSTKQTGDPHHAICRSCMTQF